MTTNQLALIEVAIELLKMEPVQLLKSPSVYLDQREVRVEVEGEMDTTKIEQRFYAMTQHKLIVIQRAMTQPSGLVEVQATTMDDVSVMERVEFNTAAEMIRQVLGQFGLQKVSLKDGDIVLTFITPQVGARYQDEMLALSHRLGYRLSVYPQPIQNLVLDSAKRLLREANLSVTKGPGIHVDRAEVSVKLLEPTDEATFKRLDQSLMDQTGYRLVVR